MGKSCFAVYSTILVLTGTIHIKSADGDLMNYSGSWYIFNHTNGNWYSWFESEQSCERFGYNLVSIENREEWNFLNRTIQTMTTTKWFIALKKDDASGVWRCLSDNSTVDASKTGEWPWELDEPSEQGVEENCTQMYMDYRKSYGRYNNVGCSAHNKNAGFMCEKRNSVKVMASTMTGIKLENTVTEYPFADDVHTSKPNLVIIVMVLTALFILILVVVFGLMFLRRHRRNSKQCKGRVICTNERPLSSEQTSLDPVLVQKTQSSTGLTVYLTLSKTESELATYETVSDCIKESEYNNTDETHQISKSVSEGCSDVQERGQKNTLLVSDERGIEQPPGLRDENEENNDHFYAVVHKERKGRASSKASALKKPSGRPQKGASGIPVNHASGVGLKDHAKAAMNETPQAGESTEYFYAVVDKAGKKKSPQMPPPYHGLVYANPIHSRENSAKLVRKQSHTVYAHVDHVKTATVKISQQNLEETEDG